MAKKIVVDPITRIEGHLRIEAKVEDGVITDAWSIGTMWRGIEKILHGRDPREAWYWTQRFCGVCTTVHSLASVRAVEDAVGMQVPLNAELIRNLIMGIQNVQDHVIHFYHLHALDWVDIVSALEADPGATAKLAQSISDWPKSSKDYFTAVQKRVAAFVGTKRLGPFANAYWGHPAYKLPPEANLMAVAHYLEALDWQREVIKVQAVLGAKNPHPQTFLTGGMSVPVDPNAQNALNADKLMMIREWLVQAQEFVEKVYIPDLLAVASFYLDWAKYGAGVQNYLTFGDFPTAEGQRREDYWLKPGLVRKDEFPAAVAPQTDKIAEYVTHSWYRYSGGDDKGLRPWQGETEPHYTGPKPPYPDQYVSDVDTKYSWVKAPRYDDAPFEVGPLARMVVGYAQGHKEIKETVDFVLQTLKVPASALFSTLGRTAARGIECLIMARKNVEWLDLLAANMGKGDLRIADNDRWDPSAWPAEAEGVGFHEAPRGTLSHWIRIKNGEIANYQAVVPSTWNASPRDPQGQRGPYEEALVGTPVADPEQPIEILRTIHSFDPCLACAIHVLDARGREITRVKVL
ncbi:MAG: nickel-dependent hydrogenase large subunit [Deltaproteobacteria bacterium]|nr:nickel-dependent hydrogenase large subunit [Deltaproteobacteria bacterium]